MKRYFVKTRNWHCNKTVFKLLSFAPHVRGDGYTDGDGKFYYETDSKLKALCVWLYWLMLKRWSGGWTYIADQKKNYELSDYKSYYL